MKRERYDFILGIGSACIASQALREAGLQFASYPFDWMSGPTFLQRIRAIVDDFAGWFEAQDLAFIGNPNHFTHDSYRNRVTNATYPHDFEQGLPFEKAYPSVRKKYERRIRRLYDRVRLSRQVLLVWLENPSDDDRPDDAVVRQALRMLSKKFPGVSFRFLIIDRAEDGEESGAIRQMEYGWRTVCGYRRKTLPGASARPWDLELEPIVAVLRPFAARDYRSRAERRAHRRAERQKAYEATKSSNLWDHLLTRVQMKLCRHLQKRLRKKGLRV